MSAINKIYDALLERADDDTIELCLDDTLGVALGLNLHALFICALQSLRIKLSTFQAENFMSQ